MRSMTVRAFIDAIVHKFVDEMMQPQRRGVADIHRRAMTDPFQSLQSLKVFGAVLATGQTGGRQLLSRDGCRLRGGPTIFTEGSLIR